MKALLKESEKLSPRKNYSTEKPCLACRAVTENGNTFHHILTQKAYPEHSEAEWNLMALCKLHHVEVHNTGMKDFAKKYQRVGLWLVWNNWDLDEARGKWRHVG